MVKCRVNVELVVLATVKTITVIRAVVSEVGYQTQSSIWVQDESTTTYNFLN